jgi:hypothetical protein
MTNEEYLNALKTLYMPALPRASWAKQLTALRRAAIPLPSAVAFRLGAEGVWVDGIPQNLRSTCAASAAGDFWGTGPQSGPPCKCAAPENAI